MHMKRILNILLSVAAVLALTLAVVIALALVGGNLMTLFGFRYRSVGQLILYFLLVEVVSLPFDGLCQGLPRALHHMGKVDRLQGNMLYIPADTMCTYLAFWLVDRHMVSVKATGLSLWIISFALALITLPLREGDAHELK